MQTKGSYMIVTKTFKTLFSKPLILIMSALMSLMPYIIGGVIGDISADAINYTNTYSNAVAGFTIVLTFLFIGPMATYTYQACNDNIGSDWFIRGLLKNTFKIIPVILITKLIVPVVSGMGVLGYAYFGIGALFTGAIAITFEAVAKVSIAATDSFTDAIDRAAGLTSSIYGKVAIISFALALLQFVLFASYSIAEEDKKYVYIEGLGDVHISMVSDEKLQEIHDEKTEYYQSSEYQTFILKRDIEFGLFHSFSTAFILIFCAHHFVEDKQITDAAMRRLNGDYT